MADETRVLNIKQITNNWRKDPRFVYIGRGSLFGNPIKLGAVCPSCGQVHKDSGSTLDCYEDYLKYRMQEPEFAEAVKSLKGKWLVCFCKPKPCHGDILKRVTDNM